MKLRPVHLQDIIVLHHGVNDRLRLNLVELGLRRDDPRRVQMRQEDVYSEVWFDVLPRLQVEDVLEVSVEEVDEGYDVGYADVLEGQTAATLAEGFDERPQLGFKHVITVCLILT